MQPVAAAPIQNPNMVDPHQQEGVSNGYYPYVSGRKLVICSMDILLVVCFMVSTGYCYKRLLMYSVYGQNDYDYNQYGYQPYGYTGYETYGNGQSVPVGSVPPQNEIPQQGMDPSQSS